MGPLGFCGGTITLTSAGSFSTSMVIFSSEGKRSSVSSFQIKNCDLTHIVRVINYDRSTVFDFPSSPEPSLVSDRLSLNLHLKVKVFSFGHRNFLWHSTSINHWFLFSCFGNNFVGRLGWIASSSSVHTLHP